MRYLRSVFFNAAFGLSTGATIFSVPAQAFYTGDVTRKQYFIGEVNGPLLLNLINRQRYHERSSMDVIKADMKKILDQNKQTMTNSSEKYFIGFRGRAFPDDHFELAMAAIEKLQDKDSTTQAEERLVELLGLAKSIHFHAGPYYAFGSDEQSYALSPFMTKGKSVLEFQVESAMGGVPVLAFMPIAFLSEMAIGSSEDEDFLTGQTHEPYLFLDR